MALAVNIKTFLRVAITIKSINILVQIFKLPKMPPVLWVFHKPILRRPIFKINLNQSHIYLNLDTLIRVKSPVINNHLKKVFLFYVFEPQAHDKNCRH
ncbi:MAG: hypothetical protein COA81_11330 [Alphaproteobacteria bacterium]|nr:MAG: hypothetical protein COA81_11330 [Alphaproteobacteria bacterium]